MWEFGFAVLMTFCLAVGMILRYAPFAAMTDQRHRRNLILFYNSVCIVNTAVLFWVCVRYGVSMEILRNDLLIFGVVTTLVNVLVIPGHVFEHVFVYGIVATCNYMLLSVPMVLSGFYSGLSEQARYVLIALTYALLLALCYVPTRKLLRNSVEPFLIQDSGNYWKHIWFIPAAMFLAMFLTYNGGGNIDSVKYLLSRGLMALATIMICHAIAEDHKRMLEKKEMFRQLADQKIHYAHLESRIDDLRRVRHDFKHHLAVIDRLAHMEDREPLLDYCRKLSDREKKQVRIPYTGNVAADGVLYRYMNLAKENDVQFQYSGSITSDCIQDIDLCVLLGNALDNAFEGCMTIQTGRIIHVIMQTEPGLISVAVCNTFDGSIVCREEEILSRKRKDRTGIGLSSMKSVCDQYGGTMDMNWDETTFTVMFMIPNH